MNLVNSIQQGFHSKILGKRQLFPNDCLISKEGFDERVVALIYEFSISRQLRIDYNTF